MTSTTLEGPTAFPAPPITDQGLVPAHNRRGISIRSLVRGRQDDPVWVRPSVITLIVLTALLYIVGLGASGWANSFYSAAVQAGTKNWAAFFFGSLDAGNSITVDKPPAALWVMGISARIFGLNSWSLLVPEALEGVAAVALLYATVRRVFTPAAGLIAAAVLALTPAAVLMFRFNNPDALLVLLLVGAAYALVRAVEGGSSRWMVLSGTLVGFGFLTKMMQAFVILPVFAAVYLIAGPPRLGRRLVQLAYALLAVVVSSGWWVAIVTLMPAAARPYIGGSTNNSELDLIFGYNGLGRITGSETGSVGGGANGTGTGTWGPTGWDRMFNSSFGSQVSWLIPAALVGFVVALWLTRRSPRTDLRRATALLWGGWLVLTGVVFSFAQGIIHPYYTAALAPAIGAMVGIGAVLLWQRREHLVARLVLAGTLLGTAVWADVLLARSPTWMPWLHSLILIGSIAVAAALVAGRLLPRRALAAVAVAAGLLAIAAPAAYAFDTAATAHNGSIPTAGPASAGGMGGAGGPGGFGAGAPQGGFPGGLPTGSRPPAGTRGFGGPPAGFAGAGPVAGGQPTGGEGRAAGLGGLLDSTTPNAALVTLLTANSSHYTWIAATVGANNAAGVQLTTGDAVMAIGGFNGTDNSPTLAQFEADVQGGTIHYFIAGGGMGGGGTSSSGSSSQITAWVSSHYTAQTVGGSTVYDLTAPTTAG